MPSLPRPVAKALYRVKVTRKDVTRMNRNRSEATMNDAEDNYHDAVVTFLNVCDAENFRPLAVVALMQARDAYTEYNNSTAGKVFDPQAYDIATDAYEGAVQALLTALTA